MHAVVSKRDFIRILARCQGVADKKSTMPVLANVLVEADSEGHLRLTATDLYLGISGQIDARVETAGSIAVDAKDLFDRVKAMPDGNISLSLQNAGAVVIRAEGQARRYTIKGIAGSEFPSLPQPATDSIEMLVPTEAFASLIAKTHFSIATDDTRPHLNSALFQWEGERIRMVTTDGHRLSKMEVTVPERSQEASMLIPLKGIQELKRLCEEARSDGVAEITLLKSGPSAFFRVPHMQLGIKLVEVQFPPYGQVIPSSTQHQIVASRALVADAVRAVSLAASDRTGGVKMTMCENVMRFSSESPESGDGFDEVPVEFSGTEFTVGFNAAYVLHVLGCIEQDDIVLGLSGELDPATIQPSPQPEGSEFLAVIMPMRI